tara:strand:+ start:5920 stop:6906 length:987 start_codon:yes stop_codon:yes gene_type:complete
LQPFQKQILQATNSTKITGSKFIQELWSSYGSLEKLFLQGNPNIPSVIVKHIKFPEKQNHPRAWNTKLGHERKIKSYQIEQNWYQRHLNLPVNKSFRIPRCYLNISLKEEQIILLEDLDNAGFPSRKTNISIDEINLVLKFLAKFHANYLNEKTNGLWEIGTYWHLDTRQEEWVAMEDSPLKKRAAEIDKILNQSQFKTLVHGDAKLANFCFSKDADKVAAVDFQYVGGGCGMKDVAYFLGSCLNANELFEHCKDLLDYYFRELKRALKGKLQEQDIKNLEKEWSYLFDFAWADFDRFLLGWMPSHSKINSFSRERVESCLKKLNSLS